MNEEADQLNKTKVSIGNALNAQSKKGLIQLVGGTKHINGVVSQLFKRHTLGLILFYPMESHRKRLQRIIAI